MRKLPIAVIIFAVALLALAGRTPVLEGRVFEAHAYLPFVARHEPPTPTPTITPTPIPLFQGVVQIHHSENAVDGWGWPANAEVRMAVSAPDGAQRETLTLNAQADGRLPWSSLSSSVEEGDWITVTLGGLQAGFPAVLLTACGDPQNDTVEGDARPLARVHALVGHGQEWHWLETNADETGHFLLDFSPLVDWDYQDYIRVGQFLNANGLVTVSGHSPHFHILPPPTATPTQTATPTATPSQDAPPFIHIAAPAEAHVGEEIILDGAGTWDIDGDPFELTWTQYHNPDRYQGLEYVTGNDVLLQDLSGAQSAIYPDSLTGFAQVRFVPEWPGNYRFELVASDKDGQSQGRVDVLVALSEALNWEFRGAGAGVPTHEALNLVDLSKVALAFRGMRELGVTWFELGTSWFQDGYESNVVYPIYEEDALLPGTPPGVHATGTDERVRYVIELAHRNGVKVYLRPSLEAIANDGWNWRGNVNPSDPELWWESYRAFISHYADLAELTRVDALCIGLEMDSMVDRTGEWNLLIAEVRQRYSGLVTYDCSGPLLHRGALYDPSAVDRWQPVVSGDFLHHVDLIGIDWYAPLTADSDAAVAQIRRNAEQIIQNFIWPVYQMYGKPIYFGEGDWASVDGSAIDPLVYRGWDYAIDMDEQVRATEAVFSEVSSLPFFVGWFPVGFYLGDAAPFGTPDYHPIEPWNTVWNKPVMKVFELWYDR